MTLSGSSNGNKKRASFSPIIQMDLIVKRKEGRGKLSNRLTCREFNRSSVCCREQENKERKCNWQYLFEIQTVQEVV